MPSSPSITLADLGFTWPDGDTVLTGLTGSFGRGRTGLVGDNGAGKSTLLRLIAGRITPTSGRITTVGDVGYLSQTLALDVGATIADLLGITAKLAAVRAIEAGDVAEHYFEQLGDDWDIEARAVEALGEAGVPVSLDRRVGEVSGGEAMLVTATGLRLARTPVTLLDEPTNNLDRDARRRFADLVTAWPGALVVVSHDTALLERMDDTAELHANRLSVFGGAYSAWRDHLRGEQAAAQQAARTAAQAVKVEKRQRIEAATKLARRERTGQKKSDNRQGAKILMNQRASDAQVSAGKLRAGVDDSLAAAQASLDDAAARVRDDEHIRLDLPDPDVPRNRQLARLDGTNRSFVLQGPERVALIGPNGVGKTSLLEGLVSAASAGPGRAGGILLTERFGYLDQRLDVLDPARSALENVEAAAPEVAPGVIRNQLARLLLRGDSVSRPTATLSGGERFRAALAILMFAAPPAHLLILDEPTNNLDVRSVEQLVDALRGYRGGLLVVSHDDDFLSRLEPSVVLALDADGALRDATLG
ncbi:ABC transporter [Frondihabitans sucicola]|uniref:ABC transporter n=1 Tax=Frondihabitans sucicola TaxID=1268041 RepID=A0ABM8GM11_9MICO|nr:ATP-binding cassette domain-containing protein [Frondihabitans sucicola]BDZ49408.1 ABC transporter [Frondihabitans sucicola]